MPHRPPSSFRPSLGLPALPTWPAARAPGARRMCCKRIPSGLEYRSSVVKWQFGKVSDSCPIDVISMLTHATSVDHVAPGELRCWRCQLRGPPMLREDLQVCLHRYFRHAYHSLDLAQCCRSDLPRLKLAVGRDTRTCRRGHRATRLAIDC